MSQSKFQEDAAEQLRVIRTLMERATVYEALSTPAAFTGGLIGLGTAFFLPALASPELFLGSWLISWLAVNTVNGVLLARGARGRGEPFISGGMRLTLRAVSPPLVSGFVLGAASVLATGDKALCAALWAVFYGLALLAMNGFAPRPLIGLGAAFITAGSAAAVALLISHDSPSPAWLSDRAIMGATFGLFHTGYAACVKVFPSSRA